MSRLATLILLLISFISPAGAANLQVNSDGSGDFPSIQAAFDAAAPGDSIELTGGNFMGVGNVDLVVNTNDLTLWKSVHPTRIIGGGTARGLTIAADGFRMEGIGIEDCNAAAGGGVLINSGNAVFVNVRVMFCQASYGGGLNMASAGSLILDGCTFQYNLATLGGGIFLEDDSGPAEITSCEISLNSAIGSGGGIHATAVTPHISDCNFLDNSALNGGGDISFDYDCAALVERCEFQRGQALDGSSLFLGDNDLSQFEFCIFHHSGGEVAYNRGGAVFATNDSAPVLRNCTFFFCEAYQGGAIFCDSGAAPTVDKCIVAFNTAGGAFDHFDAPGIQFSCSDFFANTGGDWTGDIAGQLGVNGNLNQDPKLVHPWLSDFSIASDSPCSPAENPSCGLVGAGEVLDEAPAYVVKSDGSAMLSNIQAALDMAPAGARVLLDYGIFTGAGNRDLNFGGKLLHLGALYDYSLRPIIDVAGTEGDPHRGIWLHEGEPAGTTIQHLKIRGAYTSSTSSMSRAGYGGGLLVSDGSKVLLDDVVFEGNLAGEDGCAIYATGQGSMVEAVDTDFYDHDLILYSQCVSSSDATLTMTNCQIDASNYYGVGFTGDLGALTLSGCQLGNTNTQDWAIINVWDAGNAAVLIEDCIIVDPGGGPTLNVGYSNSVTYSGCTISTYPAAGAPRSTMSIQSSTVGLIDCDFINGNLGSDDHWAIGCYSSDVSLNQCSFSGFEPTTYDAVVANINSSLTANDCSFAGPGGGFYVYGDLAASLTATACSFSDSEGWSVEVENTSGPVLLSDCQFNSCIQGVRFTDSPDCHIEDSNFIGNLFNRTVTFSNSEGSVRRSQFDGNGASSDGAALYVLGSTVDVDSCGFTNNSSDGHGGAIGCVSSTASITNSSFSGNDSQGHGGALFIADATLTLADCNFNDNESPESGGAVAASSSPVDIDRCEFTGNIANWGGAVHVELANCYIDDSHFEANAATNAGAIDAAFAMLRINNSRIIGNQSAQRGAVYFNQYANSHMFNTLVADNQSFGQGSAISVNACSPRFANCTFVGNGGEGSAAQLYFNGSCAPEIENLIVAYGSSGMAVDCSDPAQFAPLVTCNDILGNPGGDWVGPLLGFEAVDGNFSAEPLFCDMIGGNYRLTADLSPCLPANSPCGQLVGAYNVGCYYDPVDVPIELPSSLALLPNYPNPFNPRTDIRFELPGAAVVRLSIYDVSGRLVRGFIDGELIDAGRHSVIWDGRDDEGRELSSGIYFTRFEAAGESHIGKLTLLR
ncbi:right-handed parallel beta-helix repeat-containing protein [bacterium]|nr:right-handed parallel beta-helix repeat-containing protein [bacterium]